MTEMNPDMAVASADGPVVAFHDLVMCYGKTEA